MTSLKELYKDYARAGSNSVAYILQSKEEKRQKINDEFDCMGFEFLVYNLKTKDIVYRSYSYTDCVPILRAIKEKYK